MAAVRKEGGNKEKGAEVEGKTVRGPKKNN
jgi:hypothetical protein